MYLFLFFFFKVNVDLKEICVFYSWFKFIQPEGKSFLFYVGSELATNFYILKTLINSIMSWGHHII